MDSTDIQTEAMEVATRAGHILLENGAEISRVEETMERISSYYGVDSRNFFVLSNGIFSTGRRFASVEHIPFKGTQLDKVVAVNQLSRDVERGRYSLAETREELRRIRRIPPKPFVEQVMASAMGSAGFCIIFGGSLLDSLVSLGVGLLLYVFVLGVSVRCMSKLFGNICGGALVTLLCLLAARVGWGNNISHMIIGALIPLIPGVPFTNGIRDIANEDYIAGATRLLDAMLVFFCIALGVSLVFLVDSRVSGGMMVLKGMGVDSFTSGVPVQMVAAMTGTAAFAVLFGVPRRYYLLCGMCGVAGWVVYMALTRAAGFSAVEATCVATIAVAMASSACAVWKRCPITVFLICGIFPLVPGAGIYWTTYYLISGQLRLAMTSGFTAIKLVIAIILGIVVATDMVFKLIRWWKGKKEK